MNLKPLGGRVVLEAVVEKTNTAKKGGIIIPDSAKEKPMESMVVALGTGATDDDGKKIPFEVKKGDLVLVPKYGGTESNWTARNIRSSTRKTTSRSANNR